VTAAPSGRFAYVANEFGKRSGAGNVSAYTINSSTGALRALSGSPFATGNTPVSVAIVGQAHVPLALTCPTATAQVGVAYHSTLTASGDIPPDTFSISMGSLPAGLTLNTSSGAVIGTPTTASTVAFTGKVVDSSRPAMGSTTRNCAITVSPATVLRQLSVSPTSLSFGKVPQFSVLLRKVILKNSGTGAVSISKVSVTPGAGTNSDEFTSLSFRPSSLAVGNSCAIVVALLANELGARSATLNFPNNAATSPQTAPLRATVIQRRDD
jgi:Putative Ig domain